MLVNPFFTCYLLGGLEQIVQIFGKNHHPNWLLYIFSEGWLNHQPVIVASIASINISMYPFLCLYMLLIFYSCSIPIIGHVGKPIFFASSCCLYGQYQPRFSLYMARCLRRKAVRRPRWLGLSEVVGAIWCYGVVLPGFSCGKIKGFPRGSCRVNLGESGIFVGETLGKKELKWILTRCNWDLIGI